MRVGLMGYGRAGKAVAAVLAAEPGVDLRWIARRSATSAGATAPEAPGVGLVGLNGMAIDDLLDRHPVDAMVDFSSPEAVFQYGDAVRARGIHLVSAISAYSTSALEYLHCLGQTCRVLSSPNITLGINFLMLAARMLRNIAPFADVEIVEQHFREKTEISGTARKLAEQLQVPAGHVTSLRLGGIVGHHEVIFGFPHQTVRLVHESIDRMAFGTGAVFALNELGKHAPGFYTFDDLLMAVVRTQLLQLSTA